MKVAILGYGVEGRSAYRYWTKLGADITVCDANHDLELPADVESRLGQDYLENLDDFDLLVRSPSIRPDLIKSDVPVTSVTREFIANCSASVIGVTGTKGKGTTATLISKMLEAAGKTVWLGGNIGTPALDFLDKVKTTDYVVLELSSFQLMDITQSPPVGVLLMITPEHMNWHTGMGEYTAAKGNLVRFQQSDNVVIYNAHNKISTDLSKTSAGHKVPYLDELGAFVKDGHVWMRDKVVCSVDEVRLLGEHNLENVCAAVAAAWQFIPDPAPLKSAITEFTGLPHRLELVGEVGGVKFYDDSFSTTPETAIAAIKAFKAPVVLILGGSGKDSSYQELAKAVKQSDVRGVILIGDTAELLKSELETVEYYETHLGLVRMKDIVEAAAKLAPANGIVLLSPACASFGLFKDYKDRGDQFKVAVQQLLASQT